MLGCARNYRIFKSLRSWTEPLLCLTGFPSKKTSSPRRIPWLRPSFATNANVSGNWFLPGEGTASKQHNELASCDKRWLYRRRWSLGAMRSFRARFACAGKSCAADPNEPTEDMEFDKLVCACCSRLC